MCHTGADAAPDRVKAWHLRCSGATGRYRKSSRAIRTLAKQAERAKFCRGICGEEAITDSPRVVVNKVTLLRDGPGTYRAMYQALDSAKDHINLEVYILEDDDVGRQLADLLIRCQRRGVQVNLIYDSVGSWQTPPEFFARLTDRASRW
jgi:cardiolipin synthase